MNATCQQQLATLQLLLHSLLWIFINSRNVAPAAVDWSRLSCVDSRRMEGGRGTVGIVIHLSFQLKSVDPSHVRSPANQQRWRLSYLTSSALRCQFLIIQPPADKLQVMTELTKSLFHIFFASLSVSFEQVGGIFSSLSVNLSHVSWYVRRLSRSCAIATGISDYFFFGRFSDHTKQISWYCLC